MKTMIVAALGAVLTTAALAQGAPQPMATEAEIAPGVQGLGIEPGTLPALALLSPIEDPLAYTDLLAVGSVGAPGIVAFDTNGADADIATGSLGPSKP